jgi:lipopolysaccharide biosynthesis glycosyltransferase
MHIVTATNNNYAKHLGVMLRSLLENKKSEIPIRIYVIDGGLFTSTKENLNSIVNPFNIQISFLRVKTSLYKQVRVSGHISKEAYYRISIPDLLYTNVQKALYLDCDLIIEGDITELWRIDISDYFLAAIEDITGIDRKRALSIPNSSPYFNSGVMLLNLKKWRENNISSKVLNFIKHNHSKIVWWDQDALNAILYDKWLKLDNEWNLQTHAHSSQVIPKIIHYSSQIKPWNGNPPFKERYYEYLSRTLWN